MMQFCGDILGERARLTPGRTALVSVATGERVSFGALDARTRRRAQHWKSLGVAKGSRVGILAFNCVEYVEAFFAATKVGAIFVPLNTRLSQPELESIALDAGLTLLLADDAHLSAASAVAKSIGSASCIALEDVPVAGPDAALGVANLDLEDPVCLLYTSGTTGKPKGVIIPHRQIVSNAYNTALSWQLRDTDISPIFTPLCHAGGLTVFLTPLFAIGGRIVLHQKFDASEVWRTIEAEHCTVVMGVPTIYKMLLDAPQFSTANISSIRWMISGGAPLPIDVLTAYQHRGITLRQGYGLTEVGVNCFAMSDEDSRAKPGSIGKPMLFTQAKLIDHDGRSVPLGDTGELLMRGAHVSRGYWNKPAETAAVLDGEGWFHTGDMARQDEDGFFYIVGRSKDMFISGGINVYPAEIEAELLLISGVRDAAVIGVPDEKWGEVGIAFVAADRSASLSPDALIAHLSRRLAKFKLPHDFRFVDELPRTEYGKVAKSKLRELLSPTPFR